MKEKYLVFKDGKLLSIQDREKIETLLNDGKLNNPSLVLIEVEDSKILDSVSALNLRPKQIESCPNNSFLARISMIIIPIYLIFFWAFERYSLSTDTVSLLWATLIYFLISITISVLLSTKLKKYNIELRCNKVLLYLMPWLIAPMELLGDRFKS